MSNHKDLKFDFIEMLFALAVGDLAIEFSQLIIQNVLQNYFYIYSHLLLALFILAFSYVGWRNSTSTGHLKSVKSIVSISFIILLLDLVLVIIYFIVIHSVETYNDERKVAMPAEAMTETRWSIIIFLIYVIWDILTKLIDEKYNLIGAVYIRKRVINLKAFVTRTWPTVICLFLCLLIYMTLKSKFYQNIISSDKNEYVVVVDILLFLIFAIFRGLKQKINRDYQIGEDELASSKVEECRKDNIDLPMNVHIPKRAYYTKLILLRFSFSIFFVIIYIAYFRFIL